MGSLPAHRGRLHGKVQLLWLTAGVLVGLLIVLAVRRYAVGPGAAPPPGPQTRPAPPPPEALAPAATLRTQAWDKVQDRLSAADKEIARAGVDAAVVVVNDFFAERKAGCRPFADAVLSLKGKWKYVRSRLPYGDKDSHIRFLRESFEQKVFTGDDLRKTLESAVAAYLDSLQRSENQLLVRVRADIQDFAAPVLPCIATDATLAEEFRKMSRRVSSDIASVVGVDVVRETGSFITGEVAAVIARKVIAAVAARLGVSAGILSTGVVSGVATFGLGLVAMVVVDMGIDWAMETAGYDPAGEIAARVEATLSHVQTLLVDGDEEIVRVYEKLRRMAKEDAVASVREAAGRAADEIERVGLPSGLRRELEKLDQARAQVRREALRKLLLEGQSP